MIYLDNAATSFPKPKCVYKGALRAMKTFGANAGRGAHTLSAKAAAAVYECRESLSDLFNIKNPERIAFTQNATAALNMGIKGVLAPGEHVIITSMEHNSVVRPVFALREKGVSVSIAKADKSGAVPLESVRAAFCEKTRLIVVTHASNVCGAINPIEEIGKFARSGGALFMVDAAQSAGALEIDVEKAKIDLLAAPGHKGLYGPQGTGFLYVGDRAPVRPIFEGGTGSFSESENQPEPLPDRLESGTLNMPGIYALGRAARFLKKKGIAHIREREASLTSLFISLLSDIKGVKIPGAKNRAGVVSIVPKGHDAARFAYLLDKRYGILVRAGLHCAPLAHKTLSTFETGSVRFGLGIFTTKKDIYAAASAVNKIMKGL